MLKTKTIPAYRICPKCGGAMHCEKTLKTCRRYYCLDAACDGKRVVPIKGKTKVDWQEEIADSAK